MVHRPADSRLLTNLLQHEKEYSKQLAQLLEVSNASLASFAAYAAASPPPASHVILSVAGSLAAADEALRRYALGVEEWRETMRLLKDMEDEVGNIMRDREILVTRLIKVSKSQKSTSGSLRDSFILNSHPRLSSASLVSLTNYQDSGPPSRPLSASFSSSTKLAAAQSELQACETHLAAKERELALKRCMAVKDGLGARAKAMVECGWAWNELGKEANQFLDGLTVNTDVSFPLQQPPFTNEPYLGDLPSPSSPRNNSKEPPNPKPESARPSSDFSSLGPSQSASQVNMDLPPPINIASILHSEALGEPTSSTPPPQEHATEDPGPSRPSFSFSASTRHLSSTSIATGSTAYYTPATYTYETVTYAPAVAFRVPGKPHEERPYTPMSQDIFKDEDLHKTMRIPPAHAITEYEIPTAEAGPSRLSATFDRSTSGNSTPQRTGFGTPQRQDSPIKRRILEKKITEEELKRVNSDTAPQQTLIDDDESEVTDEKKLLQEGKLSVVENPRFMTEARKKALEREEEKEREKLAKESLGDTTPQPPGQNQADSTTNHPSKEKKRFPFLHHQRAGSQAQAHISTPDLGHAGIISGTPEKEPGPKPISPAKGASTAALPSSTKTTPSRSILGSLRGFFVGKQPASPSQQQRSPRRRQRVQLESDQSDSDSDVESPTKRRGGLNNLFKSKPKRSMSGGGGGWETRTDKNLRELTRRGSGDEGSLKGGVFTTVTTTVFPGGGLTNGQSAASTVLSDTKQSTQSNAKSRGRAVSDVGTNSPASPQQGRKLKKPRAGQAPGSPFPRKGASPAAVTVANGDATTAADGIRSTARSTTTTQPMRRPRSSSFDVGVQNRKSALLREQLQAELEAARIGEKDKAREMEVDAAEKIVDLGKRRRTTSEGGVAGSKAPAPTTTPSQTPFVAQGGRGASTSTIGAAPATSAPSTPVVRKRSLTKKAIGPATASAPVSSATTGPSTTITTIVPAVPRRRNSSKSKSPSRRSSEHTRTTTPRTTSSSVGSTSAIVLPAGGEHPSGTLVTPPPGWMSSGQGGAVLSRGNSIVSGAPTPGVGGSKVTRQMSLGLGMPGGTTPVVGVGRPPASTSTKAGQVSSKPSPVSKEVAPPTLSVVQPATAGPSLMSIVEDVARNNREGWKPPGSSALGASGASTSLGDVVRAPRSLGREELMVMDVETLKGRLAISSPGEPVGVGGGGKGKVANGGLLDIKAPGSVYDNRTALMGVSTAKAKASEPLVVEGVKTGTGGFTPQKTQPGITERPYGSMPGAFISTTPPDRPLKSAMRPTSRSPPLPGSSKHRPYASETEAEYSRTARAEASPTVAMAPGSVLGPSSGRSSSMQTRGEIPPVGSSLSWDQDGTLSGEKGKQSKGKARERIEESGNDTESESFYTDEGDEAEGRAPSTKASPTHVGNGHAVIGGWSEVSNSTTSTAKANATPSGSSTMAKTMSTPSTPRRGKSVRVSLHPTFSPPPAMEYDDDEEEEEEQKQHGPWRWQSGQDLSHHDSSGVGERHTGPVLAAPIPTMKHGIMPIVDMWEDSSDEDEQYRRAKLLLTRAAKKEKDVSLRVANQA